MPKLRKWLATFGGAGFLPGAPGTWGSLAAAAVLLLIYQALAATAELNIYCWSAVLLAALALSGILAIVLGPFALEDFGRKDPGPFVLDEAAGICLTMLFQPMLSGWHQGWVLLAAFVAFRIFDVTKLPPCRRLEKLPQGWGILADDLAAAVYANLLCQLVLRAILNWS